MKISALSNVGSSSRPKTSFSARRLPIKLFQPSDYLGHAKPGQFVPQSKLAQLQEAEDKSYYHFDPDTADCDGPPAVSEEEVERIFYDSQ